MVVDQLPRLGKRELVCLLLFTCNYVVSVWRGFLFLWVLGMGYVILLWHSLSLPYNYYGVSLNYSESLKKRRIGNCTLSVRFRYASATILLRSCRAGYDYAALSSRFCGARGFPRRFSYDPTTTMKIHLVYADGDAVATLPRPRR